MMLDCKKDNTFMVLLLLHNNQPWDINLLFKPLKNLVSVQVLVQIPVYQYAMLLAVPLRWGFPKLAVELTAMLRPVLRHEESSTLNTLFILYRESKTFQDRVQPTAGHTARQYVQDLDAVLECTILNMKMCTNH